MKFADIKNDVAFRKIFGNDNKKEVLISFLNAILAFRGKQRILSVTIVNPYQLPKLKGGKVTIIDIKATDQAGRQYIIEMQVADKEGFDKRVLYYTSKSYTDQIKRGDFYRKLKPAIFVGILDFEQTQNPNYISRSRIQDIDTGEITIKDIEFNFIELPKFDLKESELSTLSEKWIYFIKNAENLDIIPNNIEDKGLQSAYQEANQHTWTQEEMDAYDYVYMREEDARAEMEKAMQKAQELGHQQGHQQGHQEGHQEGHQQGHQEGEEKKERNMVLKLAKKGKSSQEISDLLDIPIEKVIDMLENQQ
jgi:predicted transposase/invertase (TIGR01784 family)